MLKITESTLYTFLKDQFDFDFQFLQTVNKYQIIYS